MSINKMVSVLKFGEHGYCPSSNSTVIYAIPGKCMHKQLKPYQIKTLSVRITISPFTYVQKQQHDWSATRMVTQIMHLNQSMKKGT